MKKQLLSCTALLLLQYANSQQAYQDSVVTANPIIVTATKIPIKQNLTGKVVTVITKQVIESNQGLSVAQLLNTQAGITIAGALNNLGTPQSLFMRGAASGRTLILLNGVPIYDPSLINNEYDLNLLPLQLIERIEICYGAQSTLYGSDATAGVINIITTQPLNPKSLKATVGIDYGSFNTLKTNLGLSGRYNKLSYQVAGSLISSKGYSSAYDSVGNKNFDNDAYKNVSLHTQLSYQLSKSLSVKAFAQRNQYITSLDASAFVDEKDFTLKNKQTLAGIGLSYAYKNTTIVGNYQYNDNTRRFVNDSMDRPGFAKYVTDAYNSKSQFVELYSQTKLSTHFNLLLGGDYRYASQNSKYFSLSFFGPFTSIVPDTLHKQTSVYTSLFYTNTNKKFTNEIGIRLNKHSQFRNNSTFTLNPNYNINDNWRVFGSLSTGYKAPTLYQLYSNFGNRKLKPETSTNMELGIQYTAHKVNSRFVYYNRNTVNGLDFDNINFTYTNISKQRLSGATLEITYTPTTKLDLNGYYTYLHITEQSQSRKTFADTTYGYALRRPAHSLNLQATYNYYKQNQLSITLKTVGNRYDVGGYKKADKLLNGYALLGLYGNYEFTKKLKGYLQIQNITNTQYFDISGYNSMPRNITLGIMAHL